MQNLCPQNKSVTLLELLIALVLLSVVVIGFSSIDIFSRYHLLTSNRRTKLQNEVSHTLEHMTKNIIRAIGNEKLKGNNSIVDIKETSSFDEKARIKFYVDGNGNGLREPPVNNPPATVDHWEAYRFYDGSTSNQGLRYNIQYCSLCQNKNCNNCQGGGGWQKITMSSITFFEPFKPGDDVLSDNYVDIKITACWNPAESSTCGNPNNPSVTMQTRIKMPSVSTN